jgi:hypothetical protein
MQPYLNLPWLTSRTTILKVSAKEANSGWAIAKLSELAIQSRSLAKASLSSTSLPGPLYSANKRPLYPGDWDRLRDSIPSDLTAQIEQAFADVEHPLEIVGSRGWRESYHVPLDEEMMGGFAHVLNRYCPVICCS